MKKFYLILCTGVVCSLEAIPYLDSVSHFIRGALFSENEYDRHLPPQIYHYVIEHEFIDPTLFKNVREKQYSESLDQISISIERGKHEDFVMIDYSVGNRNPKDNFGGVNLGYRNGKLVGYAIFDAKGLDYVAPPPFPQEEEKKAITLILYLLEGGVTKLQEECNQPEDVDD